MPMSINTGGLHLCTPWRVAWLSIALLLGGVAALPSPFVGSLAWAQTPKGPIGPNPDYPFPDALTPEGVEVASTALIENAHAWNGRIVSFKGEAIGERMVRGRMAWIHVNDDAYMEKSIEAGSGGAGYNSGQAIWLSSELANRIRIFGDYQNQGDRVNITGTFHAACAEHGGDMDIHAFDLTVTGHGYAIQHPVKTDRALIASGLLVFCILLFWALRRARDRVL